MVPTSGLTPASDTPDVSQSRIYETSMGYGAHSPLAGNVYGPTPEAVEQALADAEERELARMRAAVLDPQAAIDAALAQGKTLVLMDRDGGKVPVVHTTKCHHARPQLDRGAVWDQYRAQLESWGYAVPLPPTPLVLDRAELESSGRSLRRCKVCAPDVPERRRRGRFGSEETRTVKGRSMQAHHVGMRLTLPDGRDAGTIEQIMLTVTTDSGTYSVPLDDVLTVTKALDQAKAGDQ